MDEIKIEIVLGAIDKSAELFLDAVKENKQFAFYGSMGVGKTTFITALCRNLGAVDLVSSPTFSIVNEYETEKGETIFHFDFYRIEEPEELYDIGFEEYVALNNRCFIEWPEKAEALVPDNFIKVYIESDMSGKRILTIKNP